VPLSKRQEGLVRRARASARSVGDTILEVGRQRPDRRLEFLGALPTETITRVIACSMWATVVAAGTGVARVRLICAEDIEGGSDRETLEPDASEVW
jgi:hypothetical protein